jgi:hypothetical protein
MIWWSTPRATVGLLVVEGIVVDCPPYARKWAEGRDARQLWRDGRRQGVDLEWLPSPPYRTVAQWVNGLWGQWTAARIVLKTNGWLWRVSGRWDRVDGDRPFATEEEARAQVEVLLADPKVPGEWRKIG